MNQELLDRLQEADHATWETYENHIAAIYYDAEGDECSLYAYDLVDCVHEAWLQHCLQAAIRARLWWYELSAKGECVAIIGHGNVCIAEMLGDTEAEALLLAYLAAIKAVKG